MIWLFAFLCIFAVCVLVMIPNSMIWVPARTAGSSKLYNVKRNAHAPRVAERLALLEEKCMAFIKKASEVYPGDARLATIRSRWNGTISEIPNDTEVAYSLDKKTIALCVRSSSSSSNDALESVNACMFVLIHELAHIATPDFGHTPLFWENMKVLLEMAEQLGFYVEESHVPEKTFCGHPLGTSPIKCVREGMCESSIQHMLPK